MIARHRLATMRCSGNHMAKATDNVDDLLAETLAGVIPRKRSERQTEPIGVSSTTLADLERRVSETLSGLERNTRRSTAAPPVAIAQVVVKEEPTPSLPVSLAEVPALAPAPVARTSRRTLWIGILLGVAMLGGGAFWLRARTSPVTPVRSSRPPVATAAALPAVARPLIVPDPPSTTVETAPVQEITPVPTAPLDPASVTPAKAPLPLSAGNAVPQVVNVPSVATTTLPSASVLPAPPPAPTVPESPRTETPAPVAQQLPAVAPPPPPAAAVEPAVIVPPRLSRQAPPVYPAQARSMKREATVVTSVLVATDGSVKEVRIIRGVDGRHGFNEAAMASMRASSFVPATRNGAPMEAWMTVTVKFRL